MAPQVQNAEVHVYGDGNGLAGPSGLANGAHQNGRAIAVLPERVGQRGLIDRVEYVRLLLQSLRGLGYAATAARLEKQTGVVMETEPVEMLRQAVIEGRFADALTVLPCLTSDESLLAQARFLVVQQHFLELVDNLQMDAAVDVLRSKLSPLCPSPVVIRGLAGCLLKRHDDSTNPLLARGDWTARTAAGRDGLLDQLQNKLPPALMMPADRLEALLEQALLAQVTRCKYHNGQVGAISLLSDYSAGPEQLPTQTAQVLEHHSDEVWHVQFSNSGTMLATASRDGTAAILLVKPATGACVLVHRLEGHAGPVGCVCWSPDDSFLLTTGGDKDHFTLRLWEVGTGKLRRELSHHKDQITACQWFPDGQHFLSGSNDKRVYMCDLSGRVTRQWTLHRVNDLAISADGQKIIVVASDSSIQILRLRDHVPVVTISNIDSSVTSLVLSRDGEWLLTNLRSHVGQLWHIRPYLDQVDKPLPPHHRVTSPTNPGIATDGEHLLPQEPKVHYRTGRERDTRYVIRSCFGGAGSEFVAAGSEESRVYVWHRESGELLAALEGHAGPVNSVAWNPANAAMLASASDDKTVRVWLAPARGGVNPNPREQPTSHPITPASYPITL